MLGASPRALQRLARRRRHAGVEEQLFRRRPGAGGGDHFAVAHLCPGPRAACAASHAARPRLYARRRAPHGEQGAHLFRQTDRAEDRARICAARLRARGGVHGRAPDLSCGDARDRIGDLSRRDPVFRLSLSRRRAQGGEGGKDPRPKRECAGRAAGAPRGPRHPPENQAVKQRLFTYLRQLEAESIHIMREVAAEFRHPVMLYSIGKDSSLMLHLALKAFYPAKPPFPLLHIDTMWKFREMIAFRDREARQLGLDLLVHINEQGVKDGISPITHGSALYTDIMKTEALKQALAAHGFDAAFGGARRDEEKSRAKERIFSFRNAAQNWDPKRQRPELWHIANTKIGPGESMRVFPLSNWTELDVWTYIYLENIPVVPLYFAADRPVVDRGGALIMVDDERLPFDPGEKPEMARVRFRTLGCYPLTGAIRSEAATVPEIIEELIATRYSERQGRVIDHDQAGSMEKKKQEGYF